MQTAIATGGAIAQARAAVEEAQQQITAAQLRQEQCESERRQIVARINSPAPDCTVEEMERLIVREMALAKLSASVVCAAERRLHEAEGFLQTCFENREQVIKRIARLTEQLNPRGQLHGDVRATEQRLAEVESELSRARDELDALGD